MQDLYGVILSPLFTEKGAKLKETENKLLLKVSKNANKIEIKKAVEKIFKVKVDNVRTIHCKGKKKKLGRFEGIRPDWKKAIVTLKKGEKLDFIEGV